MFSWGQPKKALHLGSGKEELRIWLCLNRWIFSSPLKSIKLPSIEIYLSSLLISGGLFVVVPPDVGEEEIRCNRELVQGGWRMEKMRKRISSTLCSTCKEKNYLVPLVKAIQEKEGRRKEEESHYKALNLEAFSICYTECRLSAKKKSSHPADSAGTSKTCCASNESWQNTLGGEGKKKTLSVGVCPVVWPSFIWTKEGPGGSFWARRTVPG